MSDEEYVAWEVGNRREQRMIVEAVMDREEGLSIVMRPSALPGTSMAPEARLVILFDPYVAYRNMDESYRASTLDAYPRGLKETFYTVANSVWINWLHRESKGFYADRDIKHYSIVTIADWIDVLSEFPPDVRWEV